MLIKRLGVIALYTAMGLAATVQSDVVLAKSKNNDPTASQGADASYPNGRPFQAIKSDFADVKQRLDAIGAKVALLTNTLNVQVRVAPASAAQRNDVNDAPVQLFVQVTQHGVGVTGLTAADFEYSNSFPLNGAAYCGDACFIEGENGLYGIELQGDWSANPYAGTLKVHSTTTTPHGDVTANGTSLVTFNIPAAPGP